MNSLASEAGKHRLHRFHPDAAIGFAGNACEVEAAKAIDAALVFDGKMRKTERLFDRVSDAMAGVTLVDAQEAAPDATVQPAGLESEDRFHGSALRKTAAAAPELAGRAW